MNKLLRFCSFGLVPILVVLLSPQAFAQNLLLENAGFTLANGIYLLDGTYNGVNKYTQDVLPGPDQHFLFWDGISHWNISPVNNPDHPLYYASNGFGGSRSTPPSTGWTAISKSLNPPPTISGTALPVELVSFSAHLNGESVLLNWKTETEVNNYGFTVERSVVSSEREWTAIGFVPGNGNSNSPKDYSFIDNNISGADVIYYRLKQIDNDGTFNYSPEVEVDLISPDGYSLNRNYPNPFNPSTKISYNIAQNEFVRLAVYNILGKEIKVLVNENQQKGSYSIIFYSDNLTGGVYFYKLETDHFSQTGKMLLLK